MNLFFEKKSFDFDFMRYGASALIFSSVLIVISILSLSIKGLNFGVDFTGGMVVESKFSKSISISSLRDRLSNAIKDEFSIQASENDEFIIKISNADKSSLGDLKQILFDTDPLITYKKIDFVGPQLSSKIVVDAVIALIISFIFISFYISLRFNPRFVPGAIFALIHDIIIVFGFISLTSMEFNSISLAAILTIIGYSINDTMIIYDRIRENLDKYKRNSFDKILNWSINSTLKRLIATSFVTLVAVIAIIVFGGNILKVFSIALFVGIISGTYSSVYISTMTLKFFFKIDSKPDSGC